MLKEKGNVSHSFLGSHSPLSQISVLNDNKCWQVCVYLQAFSMHLKCDVKYIFKNLCAYTFLYTWDLTMHIVLWISRPLFLNLIWLHGAKREQGHFEEPRLGRIAGQQGRVNAWEMQHQRCQDPAASAACAPGSPVFSY